MCIVNPHLCTEIMSDRDNPGLYRCRIRQVPLSNPILTTDNRFDCISTYNLPVNYWYRGRVNITNICCYLHYQDLITKSYIPDHL